MPPDGLPSRPFEGSPTLGLREALDWQPGVRSPESAQHRPQQLGHHDCCIGRLAGRLDRPSDANSPSPVRTEGGAVFAGRARPGDGPGRQNARSGSRGRSIARPGGGGGARTGADHSRSCTSEHLPYGFRRFCVTDVPRDGWSPRPANTATGGRRPPGSGPLQTSSPLAITIALWVSRCPISLTQSPG